MTVKGSEKRCYTTSGDATLIWVLGVLVPGFFASVGVSVWLFEKLNGNLEKVETRLERHEAVFASLLADSAVLKQQQTDAKKSARRLEDKVDKVGEQLAELRGQAAGAGSKPKR